MVFPIRAARPQSARLLRAGLVLAGLCMVCAPAAAGLRYEQALELAVERAPQLAARRASLDSARELRVSADQLPDPRLVAGVENLPIGGPERFTIAGESMTQRSVAWMQDVPNAAKRAARAQGAQARTEREQALLEMDRLAVQRETAAAWVACWYAERRLAVFSALEDENALLRRTLAGRVAAGSAAPVDSTMARQDAAMLADRRDELERERAQTRATLRRWVGEAAEAPLEGEPPVQAVHADALHAGIERHADLQAFEPMQRMTQAELAEAEAAKRGDWGWQVGYSRRGAAFGDMVGFQLTFELPLWSGQRQDPQIRAKRLEGERIAAEREDLQRRRREEIDQQIAELDELAHKADRLQQVSRPLAAERVALTLAAYESARGDLAAVLAARRERAELELRVLELAARSGGLRARLSYLISETPR